MLLSILPFKIRNTEEYGNNSSGKKLEVIGIKTEADNKLHYYIVNNSAECNCKKPERKVFKYFAKDNLAYNNCGKTDNDSASAHIDVCEALILRKKPACKSNKTV